MMRSLHSTSLPGLRLPILFFLILLLPPIVGANPDNGSWSEDFDMQTGVTGPDHEVWCIEEFGDGFVVGGDFETINGVPAANLALMHEVEDGVFVYEPIGSGTDGPVWAAAEYEGDLIVVGAFNYAGGVYTEGMARWDGDAWHQMSGNEAGSFIRLLVHDGLLLAVGHFVSANNFVEQWDGTQWSQYGPTAPFSNGRVYDMIIHEGELVVSGDFGAGGDPAMRCITVLREGVWQALGEGIDSLALIEVRALENFQGDLIAAGHFTYGDDISRGNVVRWDGESWQTMADGIGGLGDSVWTLRASTNALYAGGVFDVNGDLPFENLAMWLPIEQVWREAVGTLGEVDGRVNCLSGEGIDIYIGGEFDQMDGHDMNNLARFYWPGDGWGGLSTLGLYGNGVVSSVCDLAIFEGDLVAANAWQAGAVAAKGVARWDGLQWSSFGAGLNPEPEWGSIHVYAVQAYDGMLVAGGSFTVPGESEYSLAAWNGGEWISLDAGIYFLHSVTDLATYQGDLVIGGWFDMSTGAVGNSIALYDGETWNSMGGGLTSPFTVLVEALCEYEGDLYVAGWFETAGGEYVNNIARWDGLSWHPLGSGVNDKAWALTIHEGKLIVAGDFSSAGGMPADGIACWDGESWSEFGPGGNLHIREMTSLHGYLYAVCGLWSGAEVIAWDGAQWYTLAENPPGSGGPLRCLQPYADGIFIGGAMEEIAGIPSFGVACWLPDLTDIPGDATPLLRLAPNYPNPFNPNTTISFSLGQDGPARLSVHDTSGRLLRTLLDGPAAAGEHSIVWDGRDDDGRIAASGVYFSRLVTGDEIRTGKLLLSK